uniref:Large ribosomal subunit protein uL22c n=1 Tax=Oryza meridionalis TaxID=40149 RepID=A0A0E0C4N0_9ORYZ
MVGWRAAGGARAVLRRLGAAAEAAAKQDGRVFAASYSGSCGGVNAPFGLGQYANLLRAQAFASRGVPLNFHQLIRNAGISTTRNLLAADDAMVPVSSPLTPPLGDGEQTDKKGAVVKRLKVQAIKKDIKQSPKKVNLVAKLVRGMRVEDALLQLQVTVKRAAKTVYQVIHSARANAAHNHGLDPDKLIVEEAFVGKGLYLKRLSYHAKGRCGVMVRPRCRLTVVVREATPEEEAKIAKLRVSNYKKLTRKEKQLMPHRLIEVSPRWARKRKEEAGTAA